MFSIDYIKEWSESQNRSDHQYHAVLAEIRAGQGQWRYLYLR